MRDLKEVLEDQVRFKRQQPVRSPFSHSAGYDYDPKWKEVTSLYNATSGHLFDKVFYTEIMNILLCWVKEEHREEVSMGEPCLAKFGLKTARSWRRDYDFMDGGIHGFGAVAMTEDSAEQLKMNTVDFLKNKRPGYARRLGLPGASEKLGEAANEKAKSVEQQRLFGIAHSVNKGETELSDLPQGLRDEVEDIISSASDAEIEKYASTPHDEIDEAWYAEMAIAEGHVDPEQLPESLLRKVRNLKAKRQFSKLVVQEINNVDPEHNSRALQVLAERHGRFAEAATK